LIDEEILKCRKQVEEWEKLRNSTLFEIGNMLHDDVPVSNDEVGTAWGYDVRVQNVYMHMSIILKFTAHQLVGFLFSFCSFTLVSPTFFHSLLSVISFPLSLTQ
jgi:hypothetical protein